MPFKNIKPIESIANAGIDSMHTQKWIGNTRKWHEKDMKTSWNRYEFEEMNQSKS